MDAGEEVGESEEEGEGEDGLVFEVEIVRLGAGRWELELRYFVARLILY